MRVVHPDEFQFRYTPSTEARRIGSVQPRLVVCGPHALTAASGGAHVQQNRETQVRGRLFPGPVGELEYMPILRYSG